MKRVIDLIRKHEVLVVLLCLMVLLRIPNLFEPYWYGDEGIYLTLGTAMRSGLTLYKEIIDHKTPLIYFLAMTPSQFWFKLLFAGWMTATTVFFYGIARKILKTPIQVAVATLAFVLVTTLPAFEGNIANGELFVMGFVLAGLYIISRTQAFADFLHHRHPGGVQPTAMIFAGILFGLGILTKVPGLFDLAAVFGLLGFMFLNTPSRKTLQHVCISLIYLGIGVLIPIALSVLYFISRGALAEYIQFGLLYNFRYANEFGLPISNPLTVFLFSMPGKLAIVAAVGLLLLALRKHVQPAFQFVLFWFFLTLFSSLLSTRPYPHYFLQTFAPLSLLLGMIVEKRYIVEKLLTVSGVGLLVATLLFLNAGLYPTFSYYKNFVQFTTHQITAEQYRQSFNPLMHDTYDTAAYIAKTTMPKDRIFIWGTDPMLYALAKRVPAGRFTVSFHIKDFNAYDETMRSITQTQPNVVVIMRDEHGNFLEFYRYLHEHYILAQIYPSMTVYRKFQTP